MINEPLETNKQTNKRYLLEIILPGESKPCHQGTCWMSRLVKGLQAEVKPLLSAPLLAPCELGLSRFSSRQWCGTGSALPCRRGSLCLGDRRPGGGNPLLREENPARGGCRSEASHWCPASTAAGLILPLGCGGGSCFLLSNPEHKRGRAFKFKIKKTEKQLFHLQNPQSDQPTKNLTKPKQTKTFHVCPSIR